MKYGRCDLFSDHHHLDTAFLGAQKNIADDEELLLSFAIQSNCDKFECFGIILVEIGKGVFIGQITPILAHDGFHILDQQIIALYIT